MSPPGNDGRPPARGASSVEVHGDDESTVARCSGESSAKTVCGQPTILEVCAYIERSTARVLTMADNIERTAEFCERVWRDEVGNAIGRARDLVTAERIWRAA